jgi:hypothetical protein
LTIQKSSRDERVILRNDIVERYRGGVRTETRIDRAQLAPVARELFGIDLPRGPFVFEGALSCRVEL